MIHHELRNETHRNEVTWFTATSCGATGVPNGVRPKPPGGTALAASMPVRPTSTRMVQIVHQLGTPRQRVRWTYNGASRRFRSARFHRFSGW